MLVSSVLIGKRMDEKNFIEKNGMDDVEKYIVKRKVKSKKFIKNFEEGYESFKIRILLRQAREDSCLTQEELAEKLSMENQPFQEL